jgi:hypothetical protein
LEGLLLDDIEHVFFDFVNLRQQNDVVGEVVHIVLCMHTPRAKVPEEDVDESIGPLNLL